MRQIEWVDVSDGRIMRRISLYEGDLTAIPNTSQVDLVAISSFPDDYTPTGKSVIGAFKRAGLSVADLARHKEHDLRSTCSFWVSRPLSGRATSFNFDRLACFEHSLLGPPPAIVGDFFRGLFPFVGGQRDAVVAMSLFASGDARYGPVQMYDAVVEAAAFWLSRGLGIRELMIVIRDPDLAQRLTGRASAAAAKVAPLSPSSQLAYDVFLSFSSADQEAADVATQALLSRSDVRKVFDYRRDIDRGACWQSKLDEAIRDCRSVLALISDNYLKSPECREELMQARLRHKREGEGVLFPVYWRRWDGDLQLWLQSINSSDCREGDADKLASAIRALPFRAA